MVLRKLELLHHEMKNKYPNVNKGGCGAMAISLFNKLKKIKGVYDVNIVAANNFKEYDPNTNQLVANRQYNIRSNRYGKTNKIKNFLSGYDWCHLMVRFRYKNKTYYVDSLKIYDSKLAKEKFIVLKGFIKVGELIHHYNNVYWNPHFDKKNITGCRKIISKNLS